MHIISEAQHETHRQEILARRATFDSSYASSSVRGRKYHAGYAIAPSTAAHNQYTRQKQKRHSATVIGYPNPRIVTNSLFLRQEELYRQVSHALVTPGRRIEQNGSKWPPGRPPRHTLLCPPPPPKNGHLDYA